jgi:hypothetical protein
MLRYVLCLTLCFTGTPWLQAVDAPAATTLSWQAKVASALPLLGHRNWILIVDSAYPLQSSPGVETLETNTDQLEVVRTVMGELNRSRHVTPNVFMDAELPFVPEDQARGVGLYRSQIAQIFAEQKIHVLKHEQVLAKIDEAGKMFHILVLKTTMTIPYTSVFLQLDCKYWSAEDERELRDRMHDAGPK